MKKLHQLTSSTLEELYENIKEGVEQTSNLENLDVTNGAVPLIVDRLYGPLNPYQQIAITNRLSGTCIVPPKDKPPKRKINIQLAKIRVGNEVRGIELVRQFEDCRGCIKIPSCDRFEAGSILFTKRMGTGITEQDVAYKESIGLPFPNCTFDFYSHLPSTDLPKVMSYFFAKYLLPPIGIKNVEDVVRQFQRIK